ncbi:MAG: alpha/beta hydrolase family protein [Myxococcales bacterium]|nr:alpha/beta hydrolase family protein [Myxococcales bacterium]
MPALDTAMGLLASAVQRSAPRPLNTREAAARYRDASRDDMFPEPVMPDVTVSRRRRIRGVERELLTFDSRHAPLCPAFASRYRRDYPALHTVYARRLRPPGAEARPRVLYLHAYMLPSTVVDELTFLAGMARRLGVELIHMQVPYHGRRNHGISRVSGASYWTSDIVRSAEALRQTVHDARALLRWLRAEDPRPVGVAGISMGGVHTLALASLEPQLAFAMPCVAHMDVAALTDQAPVLSTMRARMREDGWAPGEFARYVEASAWGRLRVALPPARIELFAADRDQFFRREHVEAMWRALGEPRIHWYASSHMGFARHVPRVFAKMREFIDRAP